MFSTIDSMATWFAQNWLTTLLGHTVVLMVSIVVSALVILPEITNHRSRRASRNPDQVFDPEAFNIMVIVAGVVTVLIAGACFLGQPFMAVASRQPYFYRMAWWLVVLAFSLVVLYVMFFYHIYQLRCIASSHSSQEYDRSGAIKRLSAGYSKISQGLFIRLLADDQVADDAMNALQPRTSPAIFRALGKHVPNWTQEYVALEGLNRLRLGLPGTSRFIETVLEKSSLLWVRIQAALALENPIAIQLIEELARNHKGSRSTEALNLLIQDKLNTRPQLTRVAKEAVDPLIRLGACEALDGTVQLEALESLVASKSDAVQKNAVGLLVSRLPGSMPYLERVASQINDYEEQLNVARKLTGQARDSLLRKLANRDARYSWEISFEASKSLKGNDRLDALEKLVSSGAPEKVESGVVGLLIELLPTSIQHLERVGNHVKVAKNAMTVAKVMEGEPRNKLLVRIAGMVEAEESDDAMDELIRLLPSSRSHLQNFANNCQDEPMKFKAIVALKDFPKLLELTRQGSISIAHEAFEELYLNLPDSRKEMEVLCGGKLNPDLDQAIQLVQKGELDAALKLSPAVAYSVAKRLQALPAHNREVVVRRIANLGIDGAKSVILAYCRDRAEQTGAKTAPFLLAVEFGEDIVSRVVPLLDSEKKSDRKLSLKILLALIQKSPKRDPLKSRIKELCSKLGARGQRKWEEIKQRWNTSNVPTDWFQRNSSSRYRTNWSW